MPPSSRASRSKPEPDQIDLSFLSEDEDIAALRKSSAKRKAADASPSRSQRSNARSTSSAGPASARTRGFTSSRGSSSRPGARAARTRKRPRDPFVVSDEDEIIDDEEEDDDEDSDEDINIDDIIASMNGGSSRNSGARADRASKRSSAPKTVSKRHYDPQSKMNRSRFSAASDSRNSARAPPRQRRPLLANDTDEGSEEEDGSDDPQQELEDLNDESDEPARPMTRSARREQGDVDPRRARRSDRAKAKRTSNTRPTKSNRKPLADDFDVDDIDDEDDEDEDEEDNFKELFHARKRRARRSADDDDEDAGTSQDDEEEEDELVTSDESEYRNRTKRKRSTVSKSASGPKRRRLSKGTSGRAPRSQKSRAVPRVKAVVRRAHPVRARPLKMRFAMQQDLPEPHVGSPTYSDEPVIMIEDALHSDDLEGVPFLHGMEASYSPSEHTSEEEQDEDDQPSDEEAGSASDAGSISSSEKEPYKEPEAAVEKHWPRCKRCTDGPTLPLYNKALSALKRAQTREAKRLRDKSPERIDSRGRPRKALIDDTWGAVSAVQQAEEWIDVLEDRGGWFECKTCSVAWHWGCLPQESQRPILHAINTQRTLRHRQVFGEAAPAPAPVRQIEIDEMLDTASCPDCAGYASYCTLCKANVHGVRTVEEQLGFTQAMLDQYPPPPSELTASNLFRCKRCSRATHYECVARAQDDSEKSLEEVAKAVQEAGWLCSDCHRWPAVEKIIAWRQLDRSQWNNEAAKQRSYAALSTRENLPREYLVKFKGKSFRDSAWVPHDWIRILHQPLLAFFLAKGSRLELEPAELIESTEALASARKNRASLALGGGRAPPSTAVQTRSVKKTLKVDETGEVDVGPPGPIPDAQARIPKPWKTPDRILAVKYYLSVEKDDDGDEAGGEIVDSESISLERLEPSDYVRSWVHVAKILIKWQDQPYEGSTWEDPPTRRKQSDIFYDCQEAYKNFLAAQKVTFPALTADEKRKKRKRRLARSGNRFRALDDQPHCIEGGDLIDFQLEGVNWLRYGWYNEKPGILADEMGLGKTVQIITFLASIWKEGKAGPFLVVVPNATLPNWLREFEKWMPQFRVVPYWGEGEARDMISRYELFHSKKALAKMNEDTRPIKFHVVVASDTSVRIDSLPLRKAGSWDVIIVDEGQNLKSGKSLLLKRLNELHAEHRVIMTGTPLNNNVTELFNLLNWLEPGGQWKDVKALEAEYSVLKPEVIEELQKRLKPYFLRRLKKEVLDLPPKIELIVPTSLRPIQKRIYRSILESNIEDIQALANTRESGGKKNKKATVTNLNNTLMQLRKCIQHPYLIAPDLETREDDADYEATWEHQRLIDASSKLSLLQRLLPKLKAGGHRILLFSQFVINLDIVEVFLRGEGYKYLRLDGNVGQKQRQKGIDAFNAPDSPYFIYMISTRAGGVGINLATADTVIIMDPDWNPHVDMQAIARAHRIGQHKKLLVFTLMCKATAEERIIEKAKRKMMLDHLIVQNLDSEEERPDELESILKFGAQALFAEGGTEESERDVRYTDEDLDSLLRRREDAGDDEDDVHRTNDANGEAKGSFAFARVWEADQGAGAELGAVAPTTAADDDFWADLLEKHREDAAKRAQEAREREAQEKRASRRDRIKAMLRDDEAAEAAEAASQAAVKRGPGRPKKVQKPVVDEDWTTNAADASDSDDDIELVHAVQEEDELLPAVQALRQRQIKSSNATVSAAATAAAAAAKTGAAPLPATALYAASSTPAGGSAGPSAVKKPAAAATPVKAAKAASASPAPKNVKPSKSSLAPLQRDLIAEHRLPRPCPLNDIDLSLPTAVVRPGHLAAMRKVLLSLLHDSDFAREVAARSVTGAAPDLAPPPMRFQLTDTHIEYYMQSFRLPRELFEAAFTVISEDNIPAEILALPHGGATALDWQKIRELLLRTATYMVLALRRPKNEPPWSVAIHEWNRAHPGQPAPTVISIPDSPPANGVAIPPPAPSTTEAAVDVLGDSSRLGAWLANVSARGEAELTKMAQLVTLNPKSASSSNLMLLIQSFVDGRSTRPSYGPAKLSIRSGLPSSTDLVDPDVMGPPMSIPSAAASSTPSASPARPLNRVAAALSRLSAFSGGSPMKVDVSKRDLSKLNVDVAVNYRKTKVKSSRSSVGGSPRSSMGPSPSPSLSGLPGDAFPSIGALDGEEDAPFVVSEQTCIICGGAFHYLNRCPAMNDVTRASARWFQLCDQLRVLMARGLSDGDSDVATIKTTIKVMARRLNGPREQRGQGRLVPPFE